MLIFLFFSFLDVINPFQCIEPNTVALEIYAALAKSLAPPFTKRSFVMMRG
jgi:hypothetical protein